MFEFKVDNAPQQNKAGDAPRKEIDWTARQNYIVETVGTQNEAEQVVGIISSIISLGLQELPDAQMAWTGDAESEAAELAKRPDQRFETVDDENGNKIRVKKWKSKPCQQVAFTVDFPQYQLNQSKFFGEDDGKTHPLRLLLNKEFGVAGVGKVVSKPYNIKEVRNDDGSWSFKNNTQIYKLAAATDSLDENQRFKPHMLGKLLGKAALFEIRVWNKPNNGKFYLTEDIKLSGKVPKAMLSMIPELPKEYIGGVNFSGEQDTNTLKNLRQSVINTMLQSSSFEGSDVQKALIELGRVKASDSSQEHQPEQANSKPTAQQETRKVEPSPTPQAEEFEDQELPF